MSQLVTGHFVFLFMRCSQNHHEYWPCPCQGIGMEKYHQQSMMLTLCNSPDHICVNTAATGLCRLVKTTCSDKYVWTLNQSDRRIRCQRKVTDAARRPELDDTGTRVLGLFCWWSFIIIAKPFSWTDPRPWHWAAASGAALMTLYPSPERGGSYPESS